MRPTAICGVSVVVLGLMLGLDLLEAQEAKTLKERLSDKASDEQRLDNCGVPEAKRGPVPRPGCAAKRVPPPSTKEKL